MLLKENNIKAIQCLREDYELEDHQCWQQFKKGSRKAFNLIYNKYIYNLYSYGYKIAADKTLVEDGIHDLMLELWQQKEKLGHTSSVKFYLFKGLKRQLVRALQKRSKQVKGDDLKNYDFKIDFSHELHLITQQLDEDRKKHLACALQKLSKREKEIIYLRFYDGLSYEEIASLMEISVKTAYNSVHNAIGHLRKSLAAKADMLLALGR
jgi:RNA polymerase sigma-70 factor (ECF subfamily)